MVGERLYDRYYEKYGADRNDLLNNPEVTFQTFAFDRANIRALQRMELDREKAHILDVGCGTGASLVPFIRLGFKPENLAGVDPSDERIAQARVSYPTVDFRQESGEATTFADSTFDIAFESTLFMMLTSDDLARRVAAEMIRVTRPGGYVMLADWRYAKRGSADHRAMSRERIGSLFGVGSTTEVIARERGALVPPVGRFLSRRVPALYFAVQTVVPFAVGQITTVLRKR